MFFTLSKLLAWLIVPHNLLALAVGGAAVLLLTRWRRWGVRLAVAAALAIVVIAATPVPEAALGLLEDRFPPPAVLPERVDGIIVLGGAISPGLSDDRGQVALKDGAERMIEGAGLAHRYPAARLIFTGGDATLARDGLTEAQFAPQVFARMGLAPARLEIEDRSRNTYENALRVAALVAESGPDVPPAGVWLLVTSAYHMPRSVGSFRKVGFPVIPFPVDYRSDGRLSLEFGRFNLAAGLDILGLALHEWIGLLAYRLNGYVDEVYPAPRTLEASLLTTANESSTGEP